MKDCPHLKSQYKGSSQAQASGSSDAPKKNSFYALRSRGEIPLVYSVPIVCEFLEVFPNDVPSIFPEHEIDFGIDLLQETKPISVPPYRMALAELKELKAQLKDLLDKDFIRHSVSQWGAPVLFVTKKDGSLSMCID